MDSATKIPAGAPGVANGNELDAPSIANANGKGKLRLITRSHLDGRTRARKQFDAIAAGIAQDLGGEERLSTVQKHLVEAFAGCALAVNAINAKMIRDEEVDVIEQAQAVSTLVRIAARIPNVRLPREVQELHGPNGLLAELAKQPIDAMPIDDQEATS
jgi:hypothetical protein